MSIYVEACNHLRNNGWNSEMIGNLREAGRMCVVAMYYESLPEGMCLEGKALQWGFKDDILNKSGEELNSPPFYGYGYESFEDAVKREFKESGYSLILDISIEDCQTPKDIDLDDVDEVLQYLLELKSTVTKIS